MVFFRSYNDKICKVHNTRHRKSKIEVVLDNNDIKEKLQ